MKPIMLHGHERSITQIKYSREGDLLFSCSKDNSPNIWYALNGERLGTLKGHGGAVWCMDVSWDTTNIVTGSADNTCRIWDCQTGSQISEMATRSAVRSCGYSYSSKLVFFTTDKAMGHDCKIQIYDLRDNNQIENNEPFMCIPIMKSKVTSAVWGPLDEYIITGHENGDLCQWDVKSGNLIKAVKNHTKNINDIQVSKDQTMMITASKDTTAKLFDTDSLEHKKTYNAERPCNSAAISPIKPHIVLGGGQEAMEVTQTDTRSGKFDAKFYHMVFEEEFGRVKGHFGPINSVAFQPDGKGYSSGGEDGYVRVHVFDPTYFDFDVEY